MYYCRGIAIACRLAVIAGLLHKVQVGLRGCAYSTVGIQLNEPAAKSSVFAYDLSPQGLVL